MIKESHTREIAAGIPGAKLVNIKGDHFIVVRRSLEFNREVGAFLDPVMAMSCWTFWRRKKRRSGDFLQNSGSGNARMRRSPGIPKSTADTGKSWKTAS